MVGTSAALSLLPENPLSGTGSSESLQGEVQALRSSFQCHPSIHLHRDKEGSSSKNPPTSRLTCWDTACGQPVFLAIVLCLKFREEHAIEPRILFFLGFNFTSIFSLLPAHDPLFKVRILKGGKKEDANCGQGKRASGKWLYLLRQSVPKGTGLCNFPELHPSQNLLIVTTNLEKSGVYSPPCNRL